MAERNVANAQKDSDTSEQVVAPKKKRNPTHRSVERSRKTQSRSPKRRACTPEPGRKVWTDESEKDASEVENAGKRGRSPFDGVHAKKVREPPARRTRSAERPLEGDENVEDFEIIRNLHKSKELEEEIQETEKLKAEAHCKTKEEPKPVPIEMPPLIVAPPELKKRTRPKLQQLPVEASSIMGTVKGRQSNWSSSDEENENFGGRTLRYDSKAKKAAKGHDGGEPPRRIRKALGRRGKTDTQRTEGGCSSEGAPADEEESSPEVEAAVLDGTVTDPSKEAKPSLFRRLFCRINRSSSLKKEEKDMPKEKKEPRKEEKLEGPKKRLFPLRAIHEWRSHVDEHMAEYYAMMSLKNRCISQLLLVLLYCGFGAMIFRFTEGAFESFYKCGVKRVKRDFIDNLWSYSQYMREDDWKSQARRKLMEFEDQLHVAHEAGLTSYSGQKSWSFLNSVAYCLTVITTIGYGHISPSTTTGRAITIVYAIFGIPMFLILLADFGKLFTRGIKFLWAFVRRLYYTGSCKKVRRTAPVQEVMKGVQLVYDFAKHRRPSQWTTNDQQQQQGAQLRVPEGNIPSLPDTPGTPNLSAFEIDDEFNLPISVAITILLIYIFLGATIYWTWEEWSFFESFYFVFISMSTIGFGDFVPQHPVYMMASIIYLVFGLALTSMCINVVQEKLSDTFRQASTKIGATIGLRVAEDGTLSAPAELAESDPLQNMNIR